MMRWIARVEELRFASCVFRSTDYSLTPLPGTDRKIELSIFLGGEIVDPKYVLETPRLDKVQRFFHSS